MAERLQEAAKKPRQEAQEAYGIRPLAMGKRAAKKDEGQSGARGFYVYCVGEAGALARLFEGELPGAIEEGPELEAVEACGLAAVVSGVPLSDYGEEALRERLTDATWTATRALRHERVVEHFARRAGVVPLRFGTIYLRRESVASMLEERAEELRAAVARLEGREEWGLNLYVERARLREEVANVSPRMREMSERAGRSSPGQAYLLRKKLDAVRDEEARALVKRVASEIETALARACDGAARLRALKDEANEQGELAARFAFLVSRARFEQFRAAAERQAQEHAPLGFRLELTGPWPAYNFTETEVGGRNSEAG